MESTSRFAVATLCCALTSLPVGCDGGVHTGTNSVLDATAAGADAGPGNVPGADASTGAGDAALADATAPADATDADAGAGPVERRLTVGGGSAYVDERRAAGEQIFCDASEADFVVATRDELRQALADATSGQIVYLQPDADIDFTGPNRWGRPVGVLGAGVILASNRGCGDAEGGRISTTAPNEPVLGAERGARITGIRLSGPFWDWSEEGSAGDGIKVLGADVEVDNNEIWGFSYASVHAGTRTHVHHNFIHHNPRHGLGYGVAYGDDVLIEHNHFRNNRHSVASGGRNSYTARYNYVDGEVISHVFDMHREGGGTIIIQHNTVVPVDQVDDPKKAPAVTVRGVPSDRALITNNWFYNPEPPCTSNDGESWEDCSIHQRWVDDFRNVEMRDNHLGDSEPPSCDIGAPREGCL